MVINGGYFDILGKAADFEDAITRDTLDNFSMADNNGANTNHAITHLRFLI